MWTLLVTLFIFSISGKNIELEVKSTWKRVSPIIHTSEFLGYSDKSSFWEVLDNPLKKQGSNEDLFGSICDQYIDDKDIKMHEYSQSIRYFSPQISSMQRTGEYILLSKQEENFSDISTFVFCGEENDLFFSVEELESFFSSSSPSHSPLFSFDHIYPKKNVKEEGESETNVCILYGDLSKFEEVEPFHNLLKERSNEYSNFLYVFRHYYPFMNETTERKDLYLTDAHENLENIQGYGIELQIKSLEYRTSDPKSIPKVQAPSETKGIRFDYLMKEKYPELESKLNFFREKLIKEEKELSMKAWQLQNLGIQMSNIITSTSLDANSLPSLSSLSSLNPLSRCEELSQSLPIYIEDVLKTEEIKEENGNWNIEKMKNDLKQSYESFLKPNDIPIGSNVVLVNDIPLDLHELTIFSLFDLISSQQQFYDQFSPLLKYFSSSEIENNFILSSSSSSSSSSKYYFDFLSDSKKEVIWMNDLEKDERYRQLPTDLRTLLQPPYYGRQPFPRRNLFQVVFFVDPSTNKGLELIYESFEYLQRGVPIQVGFVFQPKQKEEKERIIEVGIAGTVKEEEKEEKFSIGEKLFLLFKYIEKEKGKNEAFRFLFFFRNYLKQHKRFNEDSDESILRQEFNRHAPKTRTFDEVLHHRKFQSFIFKNRELYQQNHLFSFPSEFCLLNGEIIEQNDLSFEYILKNHLNGLIDEFKGLIQHRIIQNHNKNIHLEIKNHYKDEKKRFIIENKPTYSNQEQLNPNNNNNNNDIYLRSNLYFNEEWKEFSNDFDDLLLINNNNDDDDSLLWKIEIKEQQQELEKIQHLIFFDSKEDGNIASFFMNVLNKFQQILKFFEEKKNKNNLNHRFLVMLNPPIQEKEQRQQQLLSLFLRLFKQNSSSFDTLNELLIEFKKSLNDHKDISSIVETLKQKFEFSKEEYGMIKPSKEVILKCRKYFNISPQQEEDFSFYVSSNGRLFVPSKEEKESFTFHIFEVIEELIDFSSFSLFQQPNNLFNLFKNQQQQNKEEEEISFLYFKFSSILNSYLLKSQQNQQQDNNNNNQFTSARRHTGEDEHEIIEMKQHKISSFLNDLTKEKCDQFRSCLYFNQNKEEEAEEVMKEELIFKPQITVVLNPISKTGQKYISIIDKLFHQFLNYEIFLILNPSNDVSSNPLNNWYRFVFNPFLSFEEEEGIKARFLDMPEKYVLTLYTDEPSSWLLESTFTPFDVDNLNLNLLEEEDGTMKIRYQLESIIYSGFCFDETKKEHPRGLQFDLSIDEKEKRRRKTIDQTLVMENFGYFQLQSELGIQTLEIHKGGRHEMIYSMKNIEIQHFYNQKKVDALSSSSLVFMNHFDGYRLIVSVKRNENMENEPLMIKEQQERAKKKGGFLNSWFSASSNEEEEKEEKEILNIFSVATGHLYERLLKIMIRSVMEHTTNHRVHFYIIKNYLSPEFKHFLPKYAEEYGFDVSLVTYKWPTWLIGQNNKIRIIWAYKVLFLDVLFPLSVSKIIYIDADQVTRADLSELWNMDLQGRVLGYTPFCDDKPEMDGYAFWKRGYWLNHLQGKKYHISALYVVDVEAFRRTYAGDQFRIIYENLAKDPNSLSNLDQDLPNFSQHMIPIFSLPQEWLWCETWCSQKSKPKAKTIDLCNNPETKEHKISQARRIISEWTQYDDEMQNFTEEMNRRMIGNSTKE